MLLDEETYMREVSAKVNAIIKNKGTTKSDAYKAVRRIAVGEERMCYVGKHTLSSFRLEVYKYAHLTGMRFKTRVARDQKHIYVHRVK